MKCIFSIIMEKGLGLPTGTIAFWGTLVPRILTVDYTFNVGPGPTVSAKLWLKRWTNIIQMVPLIVDHQHNQIMHGILFFAKMCSLYCIVLNL